MKKRVSFFVVFLCVISAGRSFGQATATASTTLNVKLEELRNISVSTASTDEIVFSSLADYTAAAGKSLEIQDHLVVSANKSFKITAAITSISGGTSAPITPANIKILASDGSTTNGATYSSEQTFAEANTAVPIVSTASATISGSTNTQKKFKVKYTVFNVGDKDTGDYDINLTYTVAAP